MLVAAEEREFSGILKRFGPGVKIEANGAKFAREVIKDGDRWWLVANGPGPRLVEEVLKQKMDVTGIINTGFCGALDPSLARRRYRHLGRCSFPGAICQRADRLLGSRGRDGGRKAPAARKYRRHRGRNGSRRGEEDRAENGACRFIASAPFPIRRMKTCRSILICIGTRPGDSACRASRLPLIRRPFTRIPALKRLEANCNVASESLGAFFADCRF